MRKLHIPGTVFPQIICRTRQKRIRRKAAGVGGLKEECRWAHEGRQKINLDKEGRRESGREAEQEKSLT